MDDLDYKAIGKRMKDARNALHITQEDASARCEITSSFYGNLERGNRKMSIETLVKIAHGLGVSADYLLFGSASQKRDVVAEIISEIQKKSNDEQFDKYLTIMKAVSSVIDKL
jgi:transcriptional regulator with XRE-family HTH domain